MALRSFSFLFIVDRSTKSIQYSYRTSPFPSRLSPSNNSALVLCLRNARALSLLPAALASVSFGFVLVRVQVLDLVTRDTKAKKSDIRMLALCVILDASYFRYQLFAFALNFGSQTWMDGCITRNRGLERHFQIFNTSVVFDRAFIKSPFIP